SAKLVREEKEQEVWEAARARAEQKILDLLLPPVAGATTNGYAARPGDPPKPATPPANQASREKLAKLLAEGKLDDREIEVEIEEEGGGGLTMLPGMPGMTPGGGGMGEQLGSQLE